ncbi:MAG: hypothetical protein E7607_03760 [Ruminococcaceae bacterium]|nr:hypothetical protein [Oscillospiraceae bacterium]
MPKKYSGYDEMRRKMSKAVVFVLVFLLMLSLMSISSFAVTDTMPEGYGDIADGISEWGGDKLPEGIYSDSPDKVGDAVKEMSSGKFWLKEIMVEIKTRFSFGAALFAKLCGLLILASIFGALSRSLSSESMAGAVRFCTTTAIFASIIYIQAEHFQKVELFFQRLIGIMGAMIPITGTVWAMGGNVSTATVGTSALYVFLNVCELIFAKSLVPVCCLFTALALCNTLSPEMGMRGLTGALKKTYGFFIALVMTVLTASLSAQTTLSAAADSTGARAARLVSSNIIPMVGASVGETLRTLATSVQYLKSIVGIGGVIFILLLFVPVLIELLLTRLVFLLSSGVAEMLGCETEGRFLSEIGGVYGMLIAVVSMSSVMFMLALTIFSKTAVAIA